MIECPELPRGARRGGTGTLREARLPPEHPAVTFVCPTRDRWGTEHTDGVVTRLLSSLQVGLSGTDLGRGARILLADASTSANLDTQRLHQLDQASRVDHPVPTYILTPERQSWVAEWAAQRTGTPLHVARAVLVDPGYASQRTKLDAVARGNVVSLDDDTTFVERFPVLREGALPGVSARANSQVLLRDLELQSSMIDWKRNDLRPFVEHLGKRIGDIRRKIPGLRVTEYLRDTMNVALERSSQHARCVQCEVTCDETADIPAADDATVVGAWPNKFGEPDFRTIFIARANLVEEFPASQIPVRSILAGPAAPFAHVKSRTIVDSAALARRLDADLAWIPWWFVTSQDISLANPYRTVTGQYRSDNDMLPSLLGELSRSLGRQLVYLSGIGTQIQHERSMLGYRPDLHEQATAAVVGSAAAAEAARRMSVDRCSMRPRLERPLDDYEVPIDVAGRVFEDIRSLAQICQRKLEELESRGAAARASRGDVSELRARYARVLEEITFKIAAGNFEHFHRALSTELRDQMRFFADVVDAQWRLYAAVQELVAAGRYPVLEYVPAAVRGGG